MSSDEYRTNGTRRTKLRRAVIHRDGPDPVCWWCRRPIDLTLKYPDPWSWSLDHFTPISQGGDPWSLDGCLSTHLFCNQSRGAKPPTTTRSVIAGPPHETRSREW